MKTIRPLLKQSRSLSLPLLLLASVCWAQEPPSGRSKTTVPEVKETVDAVTGDWVGHMIASFPGVKPETFPWEMNCKSVALGSGASCTLEGKPSIGPIAESCLLAYDPERKAVHYMCVTSTGEVHDHQGQWVNDKTIEFAPYKALMMGQPIVETARLSFPDAKTLKTESIVTMETGGAMTFVFTGERK
jgi:hypothetical protein